LGPGKQAGNACSSRGEPQPVASQECNVQSLNVARGEDHEVVCARLRDIVTTISRGRSAWPSISSSQQYLEEEVHGPASCAALRSARGNSDQVVGTKKSDHVATLDAKESPFEGERHAHSSCHTECFNAGRPMLCMLHRVQHAHRVCAHLHNSPNYAKKAHNCLVP
jgi:hypothetical protein